MSEVKDVVGFEDLYTISSDCIVRSKERHCIDKIGHPYTVPSRVIKPHIRGDYYRVALTKDGKRKHISLHRIIAEAFIPNPEGKPFIDHIDTNPRNNCVENLRWVTQSENLLNHTTNLKRCLLYKGEIAYEVAARNGIGHRTFITRIHNGYPLEIAVTAPVGSLR